MLRRVPVGGSRGRRVAIALFCLAVLSALSCGGNEFSTGDTSDGGNGTEAGACEAQDGSAARLERCGESCVDISTDVQHCGGCDHPCAPGRACVGGQCSASCEPPLRECAGQCVDVNENGEHCGGCGSPCMAGAFCSAGKCQAPCAPPSTACGAQCVDLTSDVANCGGCAKPCAAGELCSSGTCSVGCDPPTQACAGTCVDTSSHPRHCGTCGHACGMDEECALSACVPSCKSQLLSAKSDHWGYWWDGIERAPATFDAAQSLCQGLRGRLPTASELYRVSALQSAEIGQSIHTNPLWAITPRGPAQRVSVKLSDASVGVSATTALLFSRCVCAPALPPTYTGGSCMGTPGQACFSLEGEAKHLNIDSKDRPLLPKGSALWECGFYHGHVASFPQLLEGILSGLPNGTGVNLRVADDALPGSELLMRWTGVATAFAPATLTYGGNVDARPFRCVGQSADVPPHPVKIPNEFVGPTSRYKSDSTDNTAAAYAAAHDVCWDRGGHLARSTEMGELIQEGLPNGQNVWLRTSDSSGISDIQFTSRVVKWTAATAFFPYVYPADTSWSFKTVLYPFRCIYYPVDTDYAGPTAGACNGGCQAFTMPGGSGAMMWFDSLDRPVARLDAAVQACLRVGGHLASERDLTEAVRHGLGNGTNAFLLTSDLAASSVNLVRWLAVDKAFNDLATKYASYVAFATANHAYRCVWSNQLGL